MANGKTTFKRDKNGTLIAYRDGKRVGPVGGTGEQVARKKKTKK